MAKISEGEIGAILSIPNPPESITGDSMVLALFLIGTGLQLL